MVGGDGVGRGADLRRPSERPPTTASIQRSGVVRISPTQAGSSATRNAPRTMAVLGALVSQRLLAASLALALLHTVSTTGRVPSTGAPFSSSSPE